MNGFSLATPEQVSQTLAARVKAVGGDRAAASRRAGGFRDSAKGRPGFPSRAPVSFLSTARRAAVQTDSRIEIAGRAAG